MDASESEQYEAAIHGDREAFEMIIRTHSRTLFAIAYGVLQNREAPGWRRSRGTGRMTFFANAALFRFRTKQSKRPNRTLQTQRR